MYVILKGRVAVVKKSPEYGNIPITEVILQDGAWFGELSLIDADKVDRNTNDSAFIQMDSELATKDKKKKF